jgi:hypothetical protein
MSSNSNHPLGSDASPSFVPEEVAQPWEVVITAEAKGTTDPLAALPEEGVLSETTTHIIQGKDGFYYRSDEEMRQANKTLSDDVDAQGHHERDEKIFKTTTDSNSEFSDNVDLIYTDASTNHLSSVLVPGSWSAQQIGSISDTNKKYSTSADSTKEDLSKEGSNKEDSNKEDSTSESLKNEALDFEGSTATYAHVTDALLTDPTYTNSITVESNKMDSNFTGSINTATDILDADTNTVNPNNANSGVLVVLCSICGVDEAPLELCCSDALQGKHSFCRDCFNAYATQAFKPGGCFERCIVSSQETPSASGELPCPLWSPITRFCKITAIDPEVFHLYLDRDIYQLYREAFARVRVTEYEAHFETEQLQVTETNEPSISLMHRLVNTVTEALSVGQRMICPKCSLQTVQHGGCNIMTCSYCQCIWCYSCGRSRSPFGGSGCTCSIFILPVYYPHLAAHPEPRGLDHRATERFHKDKTLYFLKKIKDAVPSELWNEFRRTYDHVLRNVPVEGQNLRWTSINHAVLPNLRGTRSEDILWESEMDLAIYLLRQHVLSDMPQYQLTPPPTYSRSIGEQAALLETTAEGSAWNVIQRNQQGGRVGGDFIVFTVVMGVAAIYAVMSNGPILMGNKKH